MGSVEINLQPWHIYVVTGEPLARLKKIATERVANGEPWDEREFTMYPDEMKPRSSSDATASAGIATAH